MDSTQVLRGRERKPLGKLCVEQVQIFSNTTVFFIPVIEGWETQSRVDAVAVCVSKGWGMVSGEMIAQLTCSLSHHMVPNTCIALFLLEAWGGLTVSHGLFESPLIHPHPYLQTCYCCFCHCIRKKHKRHSLSCCTR